MAGVAQLDIRKINDRVSVAGQIHPEDLADVKAKGFVTVVNNRPDGEAPDQPSGEAIAQAAKDHGLAYHFIPMGRDGVTPEMIGATRNAFETSSGPVLCFCRSGTRSTTLWALSQAGLLSATEIIAAASQAGYDMSHLAEHLDAAME